MSCRAAAALLYRQGGRENLLKAVIFWQQGLGSWLALFAPLLVSFGYIVTLSAALCLAASCSWQGTHYLGSC